MAVPIDYKAEGIVFDLQRFSLNDGPGIRTIVFVKGCPLSCLWCSNPESQQRKPTLMYDAESCIGCKSCVRTCQHGVFSVENPNFIDYGKCTGCGDCVAACPAGALTIKGKTMTVESVIRELKKDVITYRESNGGITLSGGEPLVQWEFSTELLKACKAQGWHTAIETTGYGSEEAVESVFPYVDQVLFDCKTTNDKVHKACTGVSGEKIRRNAKRITELAHTIIRVPTIPGINNTEEDFESICRYAGSLKGIKEIHILPYHILGANKYKLMGVDYRMPAEIEPLENEDVLPLQKVVEKNGFRCVIGG
ncbi:MAG: glycyl-radical enzyme activating protein [Firmicutes bacterium]|nr:glycyl-radical enzyme activating protein [Bacillota bacterium]